ncbi:sodium:solute symporter family protein [Reichenbachiella sp.]|uniref:sodium:solute symporter family protein n=1 Tax=Reichenbachiella sp. TaxID=2184521 RepID=UPI003297D0A0
MSLAIIDIAIIGLYLGFTLLIGIYISKKASADLDSYFLGGKTIPWWILGVSNASGMFDITGTMWLVSMCFVYGLKSAWLPWIWPTFNQIFLMIYLSVWLRRSNVMTGAEWLKTRFGDSTGARLSHLIVVIFAIISAVGFIAYSFKGIGKFSSTFLPWDLSPDTYALIILGFTTLYVIKGGMYSVVFTELIQFIIMTIASVAVGIIAMTYVAPEQLNAVIPEGWKELFFGWTLDLDWTGVIDSVNLKIQEDGFSLFGFFFVMMVFKGVMSSMAGPVPNYDMQRILAAKSPSEAAKMSGIVSLVMFIPRYMMVAGLTILALVFLGPEIQSSKDIFDFELILPYAIQNFIPVGLTGLLIAGLLAAFMSTYAATVNAAPAYFVNDIYKKYINPDGDKSQYVKMSYVASIVLVAIGVGFGFLVDSINDVTQWIFGALFGGYSAANLLKWHWWRFNGHGFFWGMIAGLVAALILPLALPDLQPLYGFPYLLAISLIGCLLGTWLTPAEPDEVLINFYKNVRPWGFWNPIKEKIQQKDPSFEGNKDFIRDMTNVAIGIVWQLTLVVIPIYLVIKEFIPMTIGIGVFAITSFALKKNWLDKLRD